MIQVREVKLQWLLNSEEMKRLANNFDYREGMADTITVNLLCR